MAFVFNRQPSLGGQLGQAFGTGLEALARQKLEQVAQRNQEQKYENAYQKLFPEQQPGMAKALSMLEPKEREIGIKNLFAAPGQQAYAQALGLAPIENQLSGISPTQSIPRLTEKQATELAKLQYKERQFSAKEQEAINKETRPFYDATLKESKAAQDNEKRLDRMQELLKKGNLNSPAFYTLAKSLSYLPGISEETLLNPDSVEFNKLSKDFLKNIKDVFGGRILKTEIDNFLQTLPSLSQSDEGKIRIINNLKSFNEAAEIKKQAMIDVLKENKGKRPANIELLVEEKAAPLLDELANRFKQGLTKGQKPKSETLKELEKIAANKNKTFLERFIG